MNQNYKDSERRYYCFLYLAPPTVQVEHTGKFVNGAMGRIICSVHGDRPVSILWKKDGTTFGMATHPEVFVDIWVNNATSALTFPRLTLGDSGNYTCVAKNLRIVDIVHRESAASVDIRIQDMQTGIECIQRSLYYSCCKS